MHGDRGGEGARSPASALSPDPVSPPGSRGSGLARGVMSYSELYSRVSAGPEQPRGTGAARGVQGHLPPPLMDAPDSATAVPVPGTPNLIFKQL